MINSFIENNIDLDKAYESAVKKVCERDGGYRLNFGVYYTPKF